MFKIWVFCGLEKVVDLLKLSIDGFSTSLIPDDIDCKYFAGPKPVALSVIGDGNCLCNSASLLCRDQLCHGCLHLLVAEELTYFNADRALYDTKFLNVSMNRMMAYYTYIQVWTVLLSKRYFTSK